MSFSYQVVLRPSDVKFSDSRIPCKFDNGSALEQLEKDVKEGKTRVKDVPPIQVVWYCEKWDWYSLNNRRLYVYQQLEKEGHLTYVAMNRVELIDIEYDYPKKLFKEVVLYEPEWDIRATNNNLKVCKNLDSAKELKKISHLAKLEIEQSDDWVERENFDIDHEKGTSAKAKEKDDLNGIDLQIKQEDCSMEIEDQCKKLRSVIKSKCGNSTIKANTNDNINWISRKQRVISSSSGLHGFGYYHKYKINYLDKIRVAKVRAKRSYKPYDVEKSACGRIFSRSLCEASLSTSRESLSSSSSSKLSVTSRSRRSFSSSDQGYLSEDYEKLEPSFRKMGREIVPRRDQCNSLKSSLQNLDLNSLQESSKLRALYALWKDRRVDYLKYGKWEVENAADPPYVCGLCFKRFGHVVDLQQHSESLLHFACVTCGKFFASYASLGQHCRCFRHKKD